MDIDAAREEAGEREVRPRALQHARRLALWVLGVTLCFDVALSYASSPGVMTPVVRPLLYALMGTFGFAWQTEHRSNIHAEPPAWPTARLAALHVFAAAFVGYAIYLSYWFDWTDASIGYRTWLVLETVPRGIITLVVSGGLLKLYYET